jgi:hypothetical protein
VLTGARVVAERRRDGGEEWRRLELSMGAGESKRESKREMRRCGLLRGGVLTFYRCWGVRRRQWLGGNGRCYGVNRH